MRTLWHDTHDFTPVNGRQQQKQQSKTICNNIIAKHLSSYFNELLVVPLTFNGNNLLSNSRMELIQIEYSNFEDLFSLLFYFMFTQKNTFVLVSNACREKSFHLSRVNCVA